MKKEIRGKYVDFSRISFGDNFTNTTNNNIIINVMYRKAGLYKLECECKMV